LQSDTRLRWTRWRTPFLARHDLPDLFYPLPARLDCDLGPGLLARLVQRRASEFTAGWQTLEPALMALVAAAAIEIRSDDQPPLSPAFVPGSVDLTREIVTIQRRPHLLAAFAPVRGGLRVASFRPLDERALQLIAALTHPAGPDGLVSMRPSHFELAKDASAGYGQMAAAHEGRSYLSYWEHGLGLDQERHRIEPWWVQRDLMPLPQAHLRTEMRLFARYPQPPALKVTRQT
jgi:hypothetical protein